MEEYLNDICGETAFSEIYELNLSNKKLTSIEPAILNKCVNLEKLDVSRNRLKTFSGICLPKLKILNFEDNSVSDVTFLHDLPGLEKIYFDGNPLSVADRYIAIDQLPNLKLLDGKPCEDMKETLWQFEQRLTSESARIYSTKYEQLVKAATRFDQISQHRRMLTRELMNKLSSSSVVPPKFQRYKVQRYVENLFKNIEKPVSPGTPQKNSSKFSVFSPNFVITKLDKLHLSSPTVNGKEPSKEKPQDAALSLGTKLKYLENHMPTPLLVKKKLNYLNHENKKSRKLEKLRKKLTTVQIIDVEPPALPVKGRKRKLPVNDDVEERYLNYGPELFLRCHVPTNDPQDCDTSVWAAKFEIDTHNENRTTDLVATCGGNIVCFINCQTGHVVMRYKCESQSENLFALSWTILLPSGQKHSTSILATGGFEGKVYLIHPLQLKCYLTYKAHSQQINCLQFHPVEKTWLFSGGKDSYIHLWDIGQISLPDYGAKHKKLATFDAQAAVIQFILHETHDCLFASLDDTLAVWDLNEKWTSQRKPSVVLTLPDSCTSEKKGVVDGLTLVSDSCIAIKMSKSGKVVVWDPNTLFHSGKLIKKKMQEISPNAIFLWSDCDCDYSDLGCCKNESIVACGDNAGRLWLYDVCKYTVNIPPNTSSELSLPSVVLPWPNLSFENEKLCMQRKVIVNSVQFNWNGNYMVSCTNSNLVCIWKRE